MRDGKMERALGATSLGIGIAELFAPVWVDKTLGVEDHPVLTRILGVRDVVTGIGTLARPHAPLWSYSRLMGDVLRIAVLGVALRSSHRRAVVLGALGAIVAVGVLNGLATRRL
jgi:hypothetical protein